MPTHISDVDESAEPVHDITGISGVVSNAIYIGVLACAKSTPFGFLIVNVDFILNIYIKNIFSVY